MCNKEICDIKLLLTPNSYVEVEVEPGVVSSVRPSTPVRRSGPDQHRHRWLEVAGGGWKHS